VPTKTDPYAVLGVSSKATQAEITHAYRRQLRTHHPDTRSKKSTSGADERLRQILAAYALLRDPRRRADYDRTVHRADADPRPVQIPVTSFEPTDEQPPLWAGPVRWHR
jgi:curved DNA-binding protein CbpA